MKRNLTWLVAFALILSLVWLPAGANEPLPEPLVVASLTGLSGNFFTEMWGNNTSDIDVRELLHDYPTVLWSLDGNVVVNKTVVRSLTQKDEPDGNKTFTITIRDGLKYSDGSAITASDYVYMLLLEDSPLIREIGATVAAKSYILGAEDYITGKSETLTGVRLLDKLTFSITVDKEWLPFFYEQAYARANPYPIAVIQPGHTVKDDGQGVYIEGERSVEQLRKTVLDLNTGYMSHPKVTSGPYRLVSYDRFSRIVELEINPYYAGNFEGQKPSIPRIRLRQTFYETMLNELKAGRIHIINKISAASVADQLPGMQAAREANYVGYERTGLGFLTFKNESGVMFSHHMRRAIAHAVDVDSFVKDYLGVHGEVVYGYYGIGQWMVKELKDSLKELDLYAYNPRYSAQMLDLAGWTFDENGNEYNPSAGGTRYRKVGEELQPLVIRFAITLENYAAEAIVKQLETNLTAIGVKLEVTRMAMSTLLNSYYRLTPRDYDMFFMGSNFTGLFDPYFTYNTADEYQGTLNTSGLIDPEMMRLANELRHTPAGDREEYKVRWMNFQRYWASQLPALPLYSNIYYDAFNTHLVNFRPDVYNSWATAILHATWK